MPLVLPPDRALNRFALKSEAVATLRLLSCADTGFEELEIGKGNAERWVVRMNNETRELVGSSIDEGEADAAKEDEPSSSPPIEAPFAAPCDREDPEQTAAD